MKESSLKDDIQTTICDLHTDYTKTDKAFYILFRIYNDKDKIREKMIYLRKHQIKIQ